MRDALSERANVVDVQRPHVLSDMDVVERHLTRHGHRGAVPDIPQDLDQSLGVLVRTGARRVRRFKLSSVCVYGAERGLVARRAKPEMNHLRAKPGMAEIGRAHV